MRLAALLLLFATLPAMGQTPIVQSKFVSALSYPAPSAIYSEVLKPTAAGDTVFVTIPPTGNPIVTSLQGNIFVQVCPDLWEETVQAASETITVTYPSVTYTIIAIAEYSGGWVEDACGIAGGSGTAATSPTVTASAGDLLIGYGWNSTSNYVGATAVAPLTLEGFGNIFIEDGMNATADSVSSSAAWSSSVNWTQAIAAFKPTVQTVTLAASGSVAYDDGSSPFGQTGTTVSVLQQEGTSWQNIGNLNVAPNNTVSGSLTVNPNFLVGGQVMLEVSIAGITPFAPVGFDPRQFQQGSTGLLLNIVLFKSITLPKSESMALTP
jgi:hypothetical protein